MGTTSREPVDGSRQAYDLFLRGGVGQLQAIARPLIRRVPTARLEAAVDGLIEAWIGGRADGEPFRDFCIRTQDEDLQAAAAGPIASGGWSGVIFEPRGDGATHRGAHGGSTR
jgi:sulfite reductase beta subunit-like hemoprotein